MVSLKTKRNYWSNIHESLDLIIDVYHKAADCMQVKN